MAIATSKEALALAATGAIRERLTAARTYYVDPAGNDSNDGLTPGASGAFATLAKALNVVSCELDIQAPVTIQLANGTYTEPGLFLSNYVACEGYFPTIEGNGGDPTLVIIDGTGGGGQAVLTCETSQAQGWNVNNVKLQSSDGPLIRGTVNGYLRGFNIHFGATGGIGHQIWSDDQSLITISTPTIDAGATRFSYASENGQLTITGTVTISTPVTYTQEFASCKQSGFLKYSGVTFVNPGNVTGKKFEIEDNGYIHTSSEDLNYFPGTIAGTISDTSGYDEITGLEQNNKIRERLTADTTWFVNPATGDDANDGLSSLNAKRTPQGAMDDIADNYDANGFDVTIQLEDGIYLDSAVAPGGAGTPILEIRQVVGLGGNWRPGATNFGVITITGNNATPSSVRFQSTNGYGIVSYFEDIRRAQVSGIRFEGLAGGDFSFYIETNGTIRLDVSDCDFLTASGPIAVVAGGTSTVSLNSGISILEGAITTSIRIGQARSLGQIFLTPMIPLTGTITWSPSAFFADSRASIGFNPGFGFIGAATGRRFILTNHAFIDDRTGGGLTTIPGSPGDFGTLIASYSGKTLYTRTNVETLAANKTLVDGEDSRVQILDPGGANRDVNLPSSGTLILEEYLVINPAGSGFDLLLKESGGTLSTITPGSQAAVVYDGTDWITI